MLARAERENLLLLTTEKDLVRLAGEPELAALADAVRALPVTLVVERERALPDLVLAAMQPK